MSEHKIPSDLPQWITDHLRQYLESNGEDGHMWDSTSVGGPGILPTLLLTTTGRKSGEPRVLPLIYGPSGKDFIVIASKGGAPAHPAWYLNLVANPAVQVQMGSEQFNAKARTVTGPERSAMWDQLAVIYPPYTHYQASTDREIPVVILERLDAESGL